jgi:hypothetical protein
VLQQVEPAVGRHIRHHALDCDHVARRNPQLTLTRWRPRARPEENAPWRLRKAAALQERALAVRVLDAASVQVTSPAAAEARWDIEFYPVPESSTVGQTPDALVTQVKNEIIVSM